MQRRWMGGIALLQWLECVAPPYREAILKWQIPAWRERRAIFFSKAPCLQLSRTEEFKLEASHRISFCTGTTQKGVCRHWRGPTKQGNWLGMSHEFIIFLFGDKAEEFSGILGSCWSLPGNCFKHARSDCRRERSRRRRRRRRRSSSSSSSSCCCCCCCCSCCWIRRRRGWKRIFKRVLWRSFVRISSIMTSLFSSKWEKGPCGFAFHNLLRNRWMRYYPGKRSIHHHHHHHRGIPPLSGSVARARGDRAW